MGIEQKTGLILTGGGARAAYQVGVLQAISRILWEAGWPPARNPFDIICGTSAGAINATALACRADNFGEGVQKLLDVWENIAVEQVYRADSLGVLRSGARWLSLLSFGWLLRKWRAAPPASLLDNTPLVGLLHRMLDLPRLDAALSDGLLHALAVTASSYTAGNHVTFYQSAAEIAPWVRMQRMALQDQIGVEHLLASSAIPFIFPAVPLYMGGRREYCGDGSMRQLAPISPAIHLGATKVLVVGAGRLTEPPRTRPQPGALSEPGADRRPCDVLDLPRQPGGRHRAPEPHQPDPVDAAARVPGQDPAQPVELLVIAPSERLDEIASRHVRQPAGADPHAAVGDRRDRSARRGAGVLPAVRVELHARTDRASASATPTRAGPTCWPSSAS